MRIEESTIIQSAPEEVFAFLEQRANDSQWMAVVQQSDWLDPATPVGVGRRGRMVLKSLSGQANLEDRPKVEVRVLSPSDAAAATDVLARAFDQEPAKLAMLPDSEIRRIVFEIGVNARLRETLRHGTVHGGYVNSELGAVAVWYPPGVPMLSVGGAVRMALALLSNAGTLAKGFPHIVRTLLRDLPGAFDLVRKRRPAVARATRGMTWRLDVLGTVPEYRGKGLARALLEKQLHRCDQGSAAVWLEATDPINPPIYERFGFETVAHIDGPKWLAGYWVMRREPATARGSGSAQKFHKSQFLG